ncbi:c-type cytochrome [Methylibium sp.]|uniref:c-type cytochrome n=1 Tax=Methylibium sp. TaxID=2067992 RepID=UPI003D141DBC
MNPLQSLAGVLLASLCLAAVSAQDAPGSRAAPRDTPAQRSPPQDTLAQRGPPQDTLAQRGPPQDTLAQRGPPQDTLAQRVVACTTCHGKEGQATNLGYFPRIAGKPAGYLYHQLVNFRDGRRHYPLMSALIEPLSDDYLREIAEYFANLDLPYPPPQTRDAPLAMLERGRVLVRQGDAARKLPACVQCHGEAMLGVKPAIPGLLGLPRDYLNSQLGQWRQGQRHAEAPDCMAEVARRLAPQDIAALSTWLSSQPVPAGAKPAATLPAKLPLTCGGVPQ